jgi:hypothetical protein
MCCTPIDVSNDARRMDFIGSDVSNDDRSVPPMNGQTALVRRSKHPTPIASGFPMLQLPCGMEDDGVVIPSAATLPLLCCCRRRSSRSRRHHHRPNSPVAVAPTTTTTTTTHFLLSEGDRCRLQQTQQQRLERRATSTRQVLCRRMTGQDLVRRLLPLGLGAALAISAEATCSLHPRRLPGNVAGCSSTAREARASERASYESMHYAD